MAKRENLSTRVFKLETNFSNQQGLLQAIAEKLQVSIIQKQPEPQLVRSSPARPIKNQKGEYLGPSATELTVMEAVDDENLTPDKMYELLEVRYRWPARVIQAIKDVKIKNPRSKTVVETAIYDVRGARKKGKSNEQILEKHGLKEIYYERQRNWKNNWVASKSA